MDSRKIVTVKNVDVFSYMLKHDRNIDNEVLLQLDCINYPKRIPNNIASKIIEAIKTETQYSMMGLDFFDSCYSSNLEKIIYAINDSSYKVTFSINLSYFDINYINQLTKIITKVLMDRKCHKDLTIILRNCNMSDTTILLFAEALSSGKCAQGLNLQFNNIELQLTNPGPQNYNIITDDGARAIITAIRSGKCPRDLKIDLSGNSIDAELIATMNSLLDENNKRYDALACVTLLQGLNKKKSNLSKLPDDIAKKICEYVIPIQQPKKYKTLERLKLAAKPKQWNSSTSFFKTMREIKQSNDLHNESTRTCIIS